MKQALWLLRWILKAAIFFTLFAFALNNQQEARVNLFFGLSWHAPLVLVVLAVFTIGLTVGVLAMVPRWWRQRRIARDSARTSLSSNGGVNSPLTDPSSLQQRAVTTNSKRVNNSSNSNSPLRVDPLNSNYDPSTTQSRDTRAPRI